VAHKVKPRKPAAKAAGNDLDVLFPDRTLTIAGEEITVREYRFLEGLKVQAIADPVVAALAQIALTGGDATPEVQDAVLAQHAEAVAMLIALACDKPMQWVAQLRGAEGEALQQAWWAANAGFFVRRVRQRVRVRVLDMARKASAGSASSQHSPAPATATSNNSSATPNVN